jgi:hypothetical protein
MGIHASTGKTHIGLQPDRLHVIVLIHDPHPGGVVAFYQKPFTARVVPTLAPNPPPLWARTLAR